MAAITILVVTGACSSKSTPALVRRLSSTDAKEVTISSLNELPTSVGPAVVGEVHNTSGGPLGGVEVGVALLDRSGASIAHQAAPTLLHVLPAGAKSSFYIPFTGVTGTVATVSATVSAVPVGPSNTVPLTVTSEQGSTLGSDYEVTGTVTNSSSMPVNFPNVVGTFYDSSGAVVGAAADVGASDTVPPGGTAPFRIVLLEQGRLVTRDVVVAEGQLVVPGK